VSTRKQEKFLGSRQLQPETLMMGYGYRPEWSEGALKPPIFQTSTYVFKNAQEGKDFFSVAYGLREPNPGETISLAYGRINNPNVEILEDRMTLWDGADAALAFATGMSAITTTMFEFLRPGDLLLHSASVYGGTDHFIKTVLPNYGIESAGFGVNDTYDDVVRILEESGKSDRLAMIYVETPSNPLNYLVDIQMCADIAKQYSTDERKVIVAVDNTFLGPLFQQPIKQGADLVLYSATKYIGGHSDLLAGICLGSEDLIKRVRGMRTFLGSMADAWTGWLLLRSLETLKPRMISQQEVAKSVADYLRDHPKVEKVYYLGHLQPGDPQYDIYQRQCLGPGSMISIDIKGGEAEAFRFLDALQLIKLAVSLGGTESLAEHPSTMTHADVSPEDQAAIGLTDKLIRMSIGIEHPDDLLADLEQALDQV
jgi:methionine-gamma-lyase